MEMLDEQDQEIKALERKASLSARVSELNDNPEDLFRESARFSEYNREIIRRLDIKLGLYQKLIEGQIRFVRPQRGLAGFLSLSLGSLPAKMRVLDASKDNLGRVKGYRVMSLLLLALATLVIGGIVMMYPGAFWSPLGWIYSAAKPAVGPWLAVVPVATAAFAGYKLLVRGVDNDTPKGNVTARHAAYREQWFRAGAENWTTSQRVYSCLVFGLLSPLNLVFPIITIPVLTALGACYMTTYLREYRRSGSTELATIASTSLHAYFNDIAYFVVILSPSVLSSIGILS